MDYSCSRGFVFDLQLRGLQLHVSISTLCSSSLRRTDIIFIKKLLQPLGGGGGEGGALKRIYGTFAARLVIIP